MPITSLEFIDVHEIIRDLKAKNSFLILADLEELIANTMDAGVTWHNTILKMERVDFPNHLTQSNRYWYFFKCPICNKKAKFLYLHKDMPKCGKCAELKTLPHNNTQTYRVLRIQQCLHKLFNERNKLSKKKKEQTVNLILKHYTQLEDKYKIAYNGTVFKYIQNWCLNLIQDKNKPKEYVNALKDMLYILQDVKRILAEDVLKTE